ncbi:MAG: CcmD family protein [Bacteroidota bacterium]
MNNNYVEMADLLRQSGKIYVVIAVLIVIFFSLFLYLLFQDKKIKQLEKKLDELNNNQKNL